MRIHVISDTREPYLELKLTRTLHCEVITSTDPTGNYLCSILPTNPHPADFFVAGSATRFRPVFWLQGTFDDVEDHLFTPDTFEELVRMIKGLVTSMDILRSREVVLIDTETTGLDKDAEVIQLHARILNDPGRTWFIRPHGEISEEALKVHGITADQLKEAPYIEDVADEILSYLLSARYVTGFNVDFDVRLLHQSIKRYTSEILRLEYLLELIQVDVRALAVKYMPRTLEAVHVSLTGRKFDGAHDAKVDCDATITALYHLLRGRDVKDWHALWRESWPDQNVFVGPGNKLLRSPRGPLWGFGKHKGSSIGSDIQYVRWVIEKGEFPTYLTELLREFMNLPWNRREGFLLHLVQDRYPVPGTA